MKTSLIIIISLICINLGYSQSVSYNDLQNLEKRPKGKLESYTSKSGDTYNVGDTLTIGKPSGSNGKFVYITVQNSMAGIVDMGGDFVNHKIQIKEIRVVGKKGTLRVKISAKGGNKLNTYYFMLEEAFESAEIKGLGMSSNEAMEKLSHAKKKLDLELITKEEYDKIKLELSKYIK